MPLPIKLWSRLPKKGHIKNGKCPPRLEVQRALQKAGINESSPYGLPNNYLDFPLENHNPNFLLAAETSFPADQHSYMMQRDPTESSKLCPKDHCVARWTTPQHEYRAVCPLTLRVVGDLREPGALLSLRILPPPMSSIHFIHSISSRSLLY